MKKYLIKIDQLAGVLLIPSIVILLSILILKQIDMYERVISIYRTCIPIVMGVVVAFFMQPIIDRVQIRFSKRISVLVVYLGLAMILMILVMVLLPVFYNQLVECMKLVPSWIDRLNLLFKEYRIPFDVNHFFKEESWQEGYFIVMDTLISTFDTLVDYGIAYLTGFFISIDVDFWKRMVERFVPNVQRVSTFYHTASKIIYQYLLGTLLDILFIVVSVGFILYFANFPNAFLYALLLALLNLFPYIGASIGLVLIAIVALLSYEQFPYVTVFLVWLFQQLESNIIQPLIFQKTMDVRPILSFAFLFISEALFGILGVILSPIFAAIAQIGFRSYLHAKTSDKVGKWEDIWYDFDEVMREENMKI